MHRRLFIHKNETKRTFINCTLTSTLKKWPKLSFPILAFSKHKSEKKKSRALCLQRQNFLKFHSTVCLCNYASDLSVFSHQYFEKKQFRLHVSQKSLTWHRGRTERIEILCPIYFPYISNLNRGASHAKKSLILFWTNRLRCKMCFHPVNPVLFSFLRLSAHNLDPAQVLHETSIVKSRNNEKGPSRGSFLDLEWSVFRKNDECQSKFASLDVKRSVCDCCETKSTEDSVSDSWWAQRIRYGLEDKLSCCTNRHTDLCVFCAFMELNVCHLQNFSRMSEQTQGFVKKIWNKSEIDLNETQREQTWGALWIQNPACCFFKDSRASKHSFLEKWTMTRQGIFGKRRKILLVALLSLGITILLTILVTTETQWTNQG